MKHEAELISAVNEGFRKWLTLDELITYVEAERARVAKAPAFYLVAFNSTAGYFKLDANVVKLTKMIDEAGKLLDVELHIVNDELTEPTKLVASIFQPGGHPQVQFCRMFTTQKDRDSYYENIQFLSELSTVYKQSMIEMMRRQLGF